VKPCRFEPAGQLRFRHRHPLPPLERQSGHPLDVAEPPFADSGPARQRGAKLRRKTGHGITQKGDGRQSNRKTVRRP
jgi:hypothetical protein